MRSTHLVGWLLLAALVVSWASGSGCGPASRCPADGGPAWDVSEQCACSVAPDQCNGALRATCNSGSTTPYTLRWQLVNCGQRCLPPADGGTLATCQERMERPAGCPALMLLTDVGFIVYWVVTALHLLPPEWYRDATNALMVDWNWSFPEPRPARLGDGPERATPRPAWSDCCTRAISLTLTSASGVDGALVLGAP